MGQVPKGDGYAIIGNGRMALHMRHYLDHLGIPYHHWHRGMSDSIDSLCFDHKRILLLVSDSAIEELIRKHTWLEERLCIHFSGCLNTPLAYGAHPLYTFGPEPYDPTSYQSIPFVVDDHAPAFEELLPGLSNPNFRLAPEKKALYHALCVISGNFTTLLWEKLFEGLEEIGINRAAGIPYLNQICSNVASHGQTALTGPLARGDHATLDANLRALEGDSYQDIYRAFIKMYIPSVILSNERYKGENHERTGFCKGEEQRA